MSYPKCYKSELKEVAAHFDKEAATSLSSYSLHTEYSYGKRKFDTALISHYQALMDANKDGVPQLWKSIDWASEFADFILEMTASCGAPNIIEIHPPFNDYCTMEQFAVLFQIFQKKLHSVYSDTVIVIENRSGSVYHGGKFLVGKAKEIVQLCDTIHECDLALGIVLDFPQLITAENINTLKFNKAKYDAVIDALIQYRSLIKGIHIWGKKKSASGRWVAHVGNLDTYFNGDIDAKNAFINGIRRVCDDGRKRFLVPEVNSGADDLMRILDDIAET